MNLRSHLFWLVFVVLLGGCASTPDAPVCTSIYKTPCHPKHAKRGYNKPYEIKGVRYEPQQHYELAEIGFASYYGGTDVFHGRPTSNGEIFDMDSISAAHKTMAIPCIARVTNLENGRSIKVKVNDRGPFIDGRVIDVSRKTAQLLGFYNKGTARVHVETDVDETLKLVHGHIDAPSTNVDEGVDMPVLARTVGTPVPVVTEPRLEPVVAKKKAPRPSQAVSVQRIAAPATKARNDYVKRAALPQPLRGDKGYFVQSTTYTERAPLTPVKKAVAKAFPGMPTRYESATFGAKSMHRLLIGPFKTPQEAQRLLKLIMAQGTVPGATIMQNNR